MDTLTAHANIPAPPPKTGATPHPAGTPRPLAAAPAASGPSPRPGQATAWRPGFPGLPARRVPSPGPAGLRTCWFLGCHGGAGSTTLAAVYGNCGLDAGRYWPVPDAPMVTNVVLVARTHARGLQAAQSAAWQWASGQLPTVQLLGLAAIADAPGKLPRPLRELLELVSGAFPHVWQLPWVEALRLGDPPEQTPLPGAYHVFWTEVGDLIDHTVAAYTPASVAGGTHG